MPGHPGNSWSAGFCILGILGFAFLAFPAGGLLTGAVGKQFPAAADQELLTETPQSAALGSGDVFWAPRAPLSSVGRFWFSAGPKFANRKCNK